jgi:hypothetical protein
VLAAPLGRILTLDNLRKMNVIVVDWSYMCKMSGESIDLHCEVARKLWVSMLSFWCRVGYAWKGNRVVGELERSGGKL